MGCINSKKDLSDINPNIYRVINVNADGLALWNGQLEISPKELILYRKGKEPTKWSLLHLRRYGYDVDLFTFEAGRRCTTGEGIYAFRCRRAQSLFNLLQTYIHTLNEDGGMQQMGETTMMNGPNGTMIQTSRSSRQPLNNNNSRPNSLTQGQILSGGGGTYVIPNSRTQSLSPNGTLHSSNPSRSTDTLTAEGNYLEPTPMRSNFGTRYSSGIRLSSVSSGPISPEPNSPGSPNSFTHILEVTQLNQQQQYQNSNLYQEFPLRSIENNNNLLNKKLSLDIPPQELAPVLATNVLSSGQQQQQQQQQQQSNINSDDHHQQQQQQQPSTPNENDPSHMYVNVTPGEQLDGIITTNGSTPTAITTNQLNFGFSRLSSTYSIDPTIRCYENLEPGEFRPQLLRNRYSKPDIFSKVDLPTLQTQISTIITDKSEPSTPTIKQQQQQQQNRKVNYIVLDLDQSPSLTTITTTTATTTSSSSGNQQQSESMNLTQTVTTTINSTTSSNGIQKPNQIITSTISNSILGVKQNSINNNINNNNNNNNNTNNLNTFNNNNNNNNNINKSSINTMSTTVSTITTSTTTLLTGNCTGNCSGNTLLPPESPKKASLGYATIDFNKTVALSNSTVPSSELDSEEGRRTRHDCC